MLKHNPQLRKYWRSAKKITKGNFVTLDMRSRNSKLFLGELTNHLMNSVNKKDLGIVIDTINFATKKKKHGKSV